MVQVNGDAKVAWLQFLLQELKVLLLKNPILWGDIVGVGWLAKNLVHHQQTKHVEIDVHFVCVKLLQKKMEVPYIPSFKQIANVLTNVLPTSHFILLRSNLNLKDF